MSPNIQELESTSRKRTHAEFADDPTEPDIDNASDSENMAEQKSMETAVPSITYPPQLPTVPASTMESTPGSSPVPLTQAGSSPDTRDTPSPTKTPSKSPPAHKNETSQPTQQDSTLPKPLVLGTSVTKRKAAEKAAMKEQERAEKRQKKEAEAAEKRQKKEAEAAEKLQKKQAEEAEKAKKKAADEAIKAAKNAERDEKRRKKEEEELAERKKQEKQRGMLFSFIQRAPTAPSKKLTAEQVTNPSPKTDGSTTGEANVPQKSAYDRMFHPFFIKRDVTLAPQPFEMDQDTKDAKSAILDQYIRGEHGEFNPKPFNPTETFNLAFPQRRGITRPSVKKIMESIHDDPATQAIGTTAKRTESQTKELTNAQDQLDRIPMKYLSFYEDVRPPYYGTVTSHTDPQKLRSLARNPTGRGVLPLNYDYDSEAEWVEDDGEDLGEDESDDDDHDGDEEMEDFLDDSEDLPAAPRVNLFGDKEPCSTGICFEDRNRFGPNPSTYKYRLEFVLDTLEHHSGIDPFSSSYWPTTHKAKNTAGSQSTPAAVMAPPSAPTDPYSLLQSIASSSTPPIPAKDLIPRDFFDDFRRAIPSEEFRGFTKGTIVDILAKKFSSCTKTQVKTTLDKIAHRISVPGEKKYIKEWELLPAYAL